MTLWQMFCESSKMAVCFIQVLIKTASQFPLASQNFGQTSSWLRAPTSHFREHLPQKIGHCKSFLCLFEKYIFWKASCQFYNPGTVIKKDLGSISLKYKHQRRQYVCLPVSWLHWGPFSKLWHCSLPWCCKTVSFSLGWRQLANRDDLPPLLPTPILKNSTACVSAKLSSDWILASVS